MISFFYIAEQYFFNMNSQCILTISPYTINRFQQIKKTKLLCLRPNCTAVLGGSHVCGGLNHFFRTPGVRVAQIIFLLFLKTCYRTQLPLRILTTHRFWRQWRCFSLFHFLLFFETCRVRRCSKIPKNMQFLELF